ncbi:MAG: 50S ribosomal protein L9 [Desulfobacterales bacterium]|nr:50S ribosomal protein L9 [Desulfobacterales bacterium]
MKVILKETMDSLGIVGTEVKVADGYARNYLIPMGKALEANIHNKKIMEQKKKKLNVQIQKEKERAVEMGKALEGIKCTIRAKVSEDDRLYGSVNVGAIIEALEKQNIKIVEKKMIILPEPIKKLGIYNIPVKIYKGIEPTITIEVVSE